MWLFRFLSVAAIPLLLSAIRPSNAAASDTRSDSDGQNRQQQQQDDRIHSGDSKPTTTAAAYGVDVSFPVLHRVSTNYDYLPHNRDSSLPVPKQYENMPVQVLGNRHQRYVDHINGCRRHFTDIPKKGFTCDHFEMDRLFMNRRQPQSMVNLTDTGFRKVRAPHHLRELIEKFWRENKHLERAENWTPGNVYVNSWDNPTTMVNVDDRRLRGSGRSLKENIWAAASATLEEWTETELQPCSMYGIRVYHENNIMLPHVDRLPLVASAIIGVAEDLDEDWPFEMYDHEGVAHNVSVHPGDMLLFESHSTIHGHPFPLKGRYAAYIFLHFEPTGNTFGKDETGHFHLLRRGSDNGKDKQKKSQDLSSSSKKQLEKQYRDTLNAGHAGPSAAAAAGLPPYIQRESPEERNWRKRHPEGWAPPAAILPPEAHIAAKKGHLEELEQALKDQDDASEVLTERDQNGWQVLHHSIVGGNPAAVEFLVSNGAEINSRTHGGYGETPLRIAERLFNSTHPIVRYLKASGGLSVGAEL